MTKDKIVIVPSFQDVAERWEKAYNDEKVKVEAAEQRARDAEKELAIFKERIWDEAPLIRQELQHEAVAEIARLKIWGSDSHVTDLEAKLEQLDEEVEKLSKDRYKEQLRAEAAEEARDDLQYVLDEATGKSELVKSKIDLILERGKLQLDLEAKLEAAEKERDEWKEVSQKKHGALHELYVDVVLMCKQAERQRVVDTQRAEAAEKERNHWRENAEADTKSMDEANDRAEAAEKDAIKWSLKVVAMEKGHAAEVDQIRKENERRVIGLTKGTEEG